MKIQCLCWQYKATLPCQTRLQSPCPRCELGWGRRRCWRRLPGPKWNLHNLKQQHLQGLTLVRSHSRSAAACLSLVRCLGLLQVPCREEALPHPRACRTVEGAARVSVTLCGPAGNGIAAAPPEACSGRRLAAVRSALPPFWHCCHH